MDNNRELEKKIQILGDAQKSLYSFTENIFSKSFTNFIGGQYVEQSCIELQKYDRTMRLAFRSGFKCLKIGTQIWFANGNRKRIQEVQPGDLILGYKKEKLVKNKVKKAQAVGYKILKKIETSFGNTIYSSKEHKFLTDKGWKKAKDLQIDDFLLVSNKELTKGKEKLVSDEDAILLAYLIGDGCTVDLCQMGFTSSSDKRMREFVGIVNKKGWKTRIIKNTENFKEVRVTGVGISNYLRKYNLARKKSIEKGIPSEIMNSCSTTIALFLNRLWSCDGTIRLNVNTGSILYTTASFQLAKDVQYLLLSLGIPNIFRKRTTKLWNGTLYTYWIIYVSRARWQKLFLEKIGLIFSKEEKSQEIKIGLKERCYKGMTKKIPFALVNFIPKYKLEREGCDCISAKRLKSICPKTELHKLQEILNSDTVWSKIVNIENSKIEATYDIETEIGNYIAEGIVVHNSTSFYSKIMRDIMFRGIKEDLDIRYFSYKEELAGWHIGNIKSLISKNPYFTEIINMKSSAENVAQYTWDRKHLINIRPVGIVSASRGLKASSIYCVHPDTKILSSDGYKPIKTLKVGQKVLTHIGKFKEIKKVYKRKVNEEIIKLTIQDSDELLLTKNHKVLVYETKRHNRGQICTPECSFHGEKLEKKAKLHTGKKKIGPKARYTIKNNPPLYLDYKPKWKEAGKLTYNDYILFPEKLEKLKDNCYIFDRVNKRKRLESQEIRKDYLKTYEFWKFIGYFLADGHASDNNITISLNRSEKEFIADCFTIIKSLGFIPHIYNPKGTNVTTVIICNSQFSRFLKNNFYDGKFKILPSENIPKKFVSVLLQGFISGDGYISKSGIRITSISIGLLKQLQRLMLEIQIRSNIYKMKTSDTIMGRKLLSFEPKFELRIPVSDYKKLGYLTNQKIQKPKAFFFDSFSARRLKKIEKVDYSGDVYNLEVDENHSYLSHLITLKNCDDILSDPANPIHPTIILKINSLFKSVILESLKPGGEIHIIGSPLSQADIYFDPAIQKEFHTTFNPAIKKDNDGNEISTWPEFYTLEKLKKKVFVMGEKAFQSEMMMEPYYSTDSYFKKENLRKDVVNPKLKNIRLVEGFGTPNLVVAGLDIGKKKHVSALEIFEIKDGKAIQIHRKIMKGWKYYSGKKFDPFNPTQVEYCKEAIKNFGIGYIYYDNTRGEFEGANDSGLLSIHFVPIVFTSKMRVQMATDFEKAVMNKQLEIFDDEDMLNSICSVTNELISIETSSGTHGDEFWAVALALIGHSKFGEGGINDKKIRVGSKNIFGGRIPKGW